MRKMSSWVLLPSLALATLATAGPAQASCNGSEIISQTIKALQEKPAFIIFREDKPGATQIRNARDYSLSAPRNNWPIVVVLVGSGAEHVQVKNIFIRKSQTIFENVLYSTDCASFLEPSNPKYLEIRSFANLADPGNPDSVVTKILDQDPSF